MTKPQVRAKAISSVPPLNKDEFNALTDLLFESLNGNVSAITRLLGINRKTWKRWEKEPPEWPYWNLVLRYIIKHTLTGMIGRRRSPASKHKQYIREALARIPKSDELMEEIENAAYELSAAETHVRRLLLRGPMPWHEIRIKSNFTPRVLRTAAKSLGVVKEQLGYGEEKISVWRLPTTEG